MKWQEPPEDRRHVLGRRPYPTQRTKELDALAGTLRANPGMWALVEENSYPHNGNKYKRRGLEVKYRSTGDGQRQDIYARSPE